MPRSTRAARVLEGEEFYSEKSFVIQGSKAVEHLIDGHQSVPNVLFK